MQQSVQTGTLKNILSLTKQQIHLLTSVSPLLYHHQSWCWPKLCHHWHVIHSGVAMGWAKSRGPRVKGPPSSSSRDKVTKRRRGKERVEWERGPRRAVLAFLPRGPRVKSYATGHTLLLTTLDAAISYQDDVWDSMIFARSTDIVIRTASWHIDTHPAAETTTDWQHCCDNSTRK